MSATYGDLPPGWLITRLDRVATVRARIGWKALTAAEYVDDGYTFLNTPNIKGRDIDFENVNYINAFRYNESPELKLQRDDVLLAKDGNTLGITNIVTTLPRPATVNGSIAVLRPFGIEPRYLRYVLSSAQVQGHIAAVKDGMGVPHLFQRDINRFPLPLPDAATQTRVADFLDEQLAILYEATSLRAAQLRLEDERFMCMREEVVEGERYPCVPLGRLVETTRPINYGVLMPGDRLPEGIPLVEAGDVMRGPIDVDDLRLTDPAIEDEYRRSRLQPEDLVMAIRGSVGRVQVMPTFGGIANVTRDAARISLRRTSADARYVRHALSTHRAQDWLTLRLTGSAVKGINIADLRKVPVRFAPQSEQPALARILDEAENYLGEATAAMRISLSLLAERRTSLISAAVTGQFDVTTARSVV